MAYSAALVKAIGTSAGEVIRTYEITPDDDATGGNVTISDVANVYLLGLVPATEAPAAGGSALWYVTTSANKLTFLCYTGAGAATTAAKKFLLSILCTG